MPAKINSPPVYSPGPQLQGRALVDKNEKDKLRSSKSVFSQVSDLFKLIDIQPIIDKHDTDKYYKKLDTKSHVQIMVYAQLASVSSLRELQNGLEIFRGDLNHIGMNYVPGRTTIAYANEHRDFSVFQEIYEELVKVVQPVCRASKYGAPESLFNFADPIYSIDSTVIDLCHSMYDWASYRTAKGGIKIHVMLDNKAYLPVWALITDAKSHDQKIIDSLDPTYCVEKGSVICVDRAYIKYSTFYGWDERGLTYVALAKDSMSYNVIEDLPLPLVVKQEPVLMSPSGTEEPRSYVVSDQIIEFASSQAKLDYPKQLRLVTYWVEEKVGNKRTSRLMKFFTNNFNYSAQTVADIYKSRWRIELFFKDLKTHLSVKSFMGTSANAVKIQVYVSLITFLLVRYLQATAKVSWGFSHLVAVIRLILHLHRDLMGWLNRKQFDHLNPLGLPKNKGKPKKGSPRPGFLF